MRDDSTPDEQAGEAVESDRSGRAERVAAVAQMVDAEPSTGEHAAGLIDRLHRLCAVALRVVPASGAGLSLASGQSAAGTLAASAGVNSDRLEELQFTLGEGPCIDASGSRRPALEPDLAEEGMRRWPLYSPAAYELGARAVFAVPLQIGAARLGVLDIYRDRPGSLTATALRDVFTVAEVALGLLLESQEPRNQTQFEAGMNEVVAYRMVIYQAQGMVRVDLGIGLAEAMVRMRAHAYAAERSLTDLAQGIVDGKLTLEGDPG